MIMMMIFKIIITIAVTIILISSLASLGAWLTPESQSWVSHWEDQELGDRDKWVAIKINGILAILGLVSRIKSYQTLCYHCCQVNIPKCLHKIKRSPNKHGIYQVSIALAERGSGFALWREVGVIDIINLSMINISTLVKINAKIMSSDNVNIIFNTFSFTVNNKLARKHLVNHQYH